MSDPQLPPRTIDEAAATDGADPDALVEGNVVADERDMEPDADGGAGSGDPLTDGTVPADADLPTNEQVEDAERDDADAG